MVININKLAQNWYFIYVINIKIRDVSKHEKKIILTKYVSKI